MKVFIICSLLVALAVTFSVADEVADKFASWFQSNGGIMDGVSVADFPEMGRGFLATRDVSSGSMLLSIPLHLQFTAERMKSHTDNAVTLLRKLVPDADMAITAWLLLEKYRGEQSFFHPYITALPNHVSSVLYFSEPDIEEIQEPAFLDQIRQFQEVTEGDYQRLVQILQSPAASSSTAIQLLKERLSKEDYLWACSIINSRGLRFRGQIYLAPMADVVNYAPHPEPRAATNGDHFLKHHVLHSQNGTLNIFADRETQANQQYLEDYGDNPNQIYLQYHGFVPAEENPFHCLRIQAPNALVTFRKHHLLTEQKNKIVTKLGLDRPFSDCVNGRGVMSRSMIGLLAVVSLATPDVESCLSVLTASANPNYKEALKVCQIDHAIAFLQRHIGASKEVSSSATLDDSDAIFHAKLLQTLEILLQEEVSNAFRFTTSLEDDLLTLQTLTKTARTTAEEYKTLAIKYRITNKLLVRQLSRALHITFPEVPSVSTLSTTSSSSVVDVSGEQVLETVSGQSKDQDAKEAEFSNSAENNNDLAAALERFNAWFLASNPPVSKIQAVPMPIYRIGTITTGPVQAEEVYLSVPTSIIMDSEEAFLYAGISPLLQTLSLKYKTRDDFHELLLHLLYETFVLGEKSKYWPYLAVLPKVHELDIPLLWASEQDIVRQLTPSFIAPMAANYRAKTIKKFHFLANLTEIVDFFRPLTKSSPDGSVQEIFTLERYLWATAILDSRAIWWSGRRHLVPMLDFINCAEDSHNPSRVHGTKLDAQEAHAITLAPKTLPAETQLFENYGQANHVYYLYHGFVLSQNSHDCLSFEITFGPKEWKAAAETNGALDYLEVR